MRILNLRGTIRGRTIELDQDLGLEDEQEVDVFLRVISPRSRPQVPSEEWLHLLRSLATDCGVSVSDRDLSSESHYE